MVFFVEKSPTDDVPRDGKGKNIHRSNIIKPLTDKVYRPFDRPPVSSKTTTEGPKVIGGASRGLGGRDEQRSQSSKSDKWIPPSAFKRDALPENCDDVKFRKVRGILNKLTPQTFERLSDELVGVGLDSPALLKGVILLIFEKALQEPKYVSMYAQLCKKLSKKVPNFDPPNPDSATTFRRLLLNKCQDEYTNRARASAMYDQRTDRLTPEEEEEKHQVKRKMLGNIKFIGELGKLEMLTHSILHKCCEELVKKTKAEDLECLCQIMRTCGHLLDNDKGKYLMDQYFSRMKELSQFDKLPARIRFMLQDVIELRENSWVPRQTTNMKESPKPIQEIRREASDELGIVDPKCVDDFHFLQIDPKRSGRVPGMKKNRKGMEEVFAPASFSLTGLGTGPGVITPGDKPIGESNGFHHPMNMNSHYNPMGPYRPSGGIRTYNNSQGPMQPGNGHMMNHNSKNKMPHPQNMYDYQNPYHHHQARNNHMNNHVPANSNTNGYEKAPVAPRFMKQSQMYAPVNANSNVSNNPMSEELSLRPPPNSIMKRLPPAVSFKSPPFGPPIPDHSKIHLSPSQTITPHPPEGASVEPNKNSLEKKNKAISKRDLVKKVSDVALSLLQSNDMESGISAMKELKIQDKYIVDVMSAILNKAVEQQGEAERNLLYMFIIRQVEENLCSHDHFVDFFRTALDSMGDLEVNIPRVKTYVAAFGAKVICENVMTLAEVAECTEDGRHFPFLLLVFQQLGKLMEKIKLCKMFDESKVNLLNTLPKSDRTKDRLTEVLEERELSFLFPLLKIQQDMTKQLQANPDSQAFALWIKDNVDPTYHSSQGFISALMTVIFKYIFSEAARIIETDNSVQVNEKLVKEKEKEYLEKFKPIFHEYLRDHVDLQVISIYALQAAWFSAGSPKVVLLRWFMNLYELDIIEEDALLKWKEDIRDEYPGKGQALFQVNQWLLLLQEACESEAESDED